MKKNFRPTKRRIQKPKDCFYCKQKIVVDYKNIDTLKHCLSERGKIIPLMQSGLCQSHQKGVSKAIKQARYLALLPYIVRPS